ncbi:MAG: cation-transporting P-type ATPase [Patescibacteria group bacterium]|nr:cation-transporting P-type ATPase [Patescibacteria group bacterium]
MTFNSQKIRKIFDEWQTSENGLNEEEAKSRLVKYGRNELEIKKISLFSLWLRQFKNSMIYLLFTASFISLVLGEWVDALIIFIILIINSTLGFIQEYKTERILEKLKNFIKVKARVRREGQLKEIDRSLVVPGEIVVLKEGDLVPADIFLFKSENLMVNEEILTGEFYPAEKTAKASEDEKSNLVFSGTSVVKGYGEGVVIATGQKTSFGKITEMTIKTAKESIVERNLLSLSKMILRIVFITLSIVFVLNLILKGFQINIPEFLLFSVALAVSVVPEALPLITTLTLSRGAIKLAKKDVVVKRLSSLEGLGSIEIICSDKTGTLTKNVLTVKDCLAEDKAKCFLFGILASGFFQSERETTHDPFDLALWQAASEEIKKEIKNYQKIWERPFDPEKRTNALVVKNLKGEFFLIIRGAVEEVLRDSKKSFNYSEIINQYQESGKRGLRTLAVGFKKIKEKDFFSEEDEKGLDYLGFFTFSDSLKPETILTIKKAKKLGVKIKIITGDALEVAESVAKEAGLETGERVFSGEELEKMDEGKLLWTVENNNVFARVLPSQKYKIIQTLQKKYTVGFLGEGINDAPSLKLAHVAIVVDSGADVSKEAGDIILLKKDLKVIVDAIQEGRKIFANITKYIRYTFIGNFGNFYAMAAISLILPFLPMLAVQILLVNLLSDLPLIAVSTDNVDYQEIRKPRKYNLREITFVCIFLGFLSSLFDFTFFALFYKTGPEMLRTLWFICSILTELVLIFSIRTRYFVFRSSMPSSTLISVSFLAFFLTIFIPLSRLGKVFHFLVPSFSSLFIILGLVILYFIATETAKLAYYRSHKEI